MDSYTAGSRPAREAAALGTSAREAAREAAHSFLTPALTWESVGRKATGPGRSAHEVQALRGACGPGPWPLARGGPAGGRRPEVKC